MSKNKSAKKGFGAGLKEWFRKKIVNLKRNPQIIPMIALVISFLVFSLNMTDVSDTTAKIQGKGMGLAQFAITLFSILAMVCMLNAFPKRKKANIPMVIILFVLLGIITFASIHYTGKVMEALNRAESPIVINASTAYIAEAYNMLTTHRTIIYVVAALVALLPVYSKLLRKINTGVAVEGYGELEAIELGSDED